MPRLKAAVQARKETALESLRDALRTTGRLIRPRLGSPGYGAVRVALAHWRPDFDDAPEKERLALLRAATQWDMERNSKARPHARMDVERHASLTRELVEWLKAPEAAAKAAASARATSRRHARGGGGQRKTAQHAVVHRPSTHASPCKKRRVAHKKKAHALVPPSTTLKSKMSALDTAHALLHPGCHGHLPPGSTPVSHMRPGDTKPHIDFMLPDGTLDCRFDSYCDQRLDEPAGSCLHHALSIFDSFADAARARPLRHGDHVHRLAGQAVGDCGTLWPAHISEADLDFATGLFDVKDGSPRSWPACCGASPALPMMREKHNGFLTSDFVVCKKARLRRL